MRRFFATLAAVVALGAGALAGTYGSRLVLGRIATQTICKAGWCEISADPGSPNILTRALHVLRDPAGFPSETIRTFATRTDGDGRALAGNSTYLLRFAADAAPPAEAFWSLSALDAEGLLPASDAPLSVSGGAPNLRRNADGSLDVLLQATPPDDPNANWLPAPSGGFQLVLRLYAPTPVARDNWQPPQLSRQDTAA